MEYARTLCWFMDLLGPDYVDTTWQPYQLLALEQRHCRF